MCAQAFVEFVSKYFVEEEVVQADQSTVNQEEQVTLSQIFVYPIKSCGAFTPTEWPVGPHGLLHDREWAIVDAKGTTINCKMVRMILDHIYFIVSPSILMHLHLPHLFLL